MTAVKRWIPHSFAVSTFAALTALVLAYSPVAAKGPCDVVCRNYEYCDGGDQCVPVTPALLCYGTHISCEELQWCDPLEVCIA